MPTLAYVGAQAIISEPTHISETERVNPDLRPLRSA